MSFWLPSAARFMMALLFLISGMSKLLSPIPSQAFMQAYHVPVILVWPAGVWEVCSALALIFGLWLGPVSVLLAGWCLLTAVIFHIDFGDMVQLTNFFKNTTMAGAFLLLAIFRIPGWSARYPASHT